MFFSLITRQYRS